MSRTIYLWLDMVPPTTTAQGKRLNTRKLMAVTRRDSKAAGKNPYKGLFFKAEDHSDEMRMVREKLERSLSRPLSPIAGPVSLFVKATWPWLAKHSKSTRAKDYAWKVSKPDCSNWIKGIEDELVKAGYLKDDAQVCSLTVYKCHGEHPGISIGITELE